MCKNKLNLFFVGIKSVFCLALAFIFALNQRDVYAFDESLNSNLLLLVNKTHTITSEYKPQGMLNIGEFMDINKKEILVRPEVYLALKQMHQDLQKLGHDINGISGYRDYTYQEKLFAKEKERQKAMGSSEEDAQNTAATMTAPAGTSEHQTGLSVDLSSTYLLDRSFGSEDVGTWLRENCKNYGFILRYPRYKTNITKIIYEPWHFRFVGKPHSIYITENELTLEEYLQLLKGRKHLAKLYGRTKYDIYYTKNPADNFKNIIDTSYDNFGGYIITTQTVFSEMFMQVFNSYYKTLVLGGAYGTT